MLRQESQPQQEGGNQGLEDLQGLGGTPLYPGASLRQDPAHTERPQALGGTDTLNKPLSLFQAAVYLISANRFLSVERPLVHGFNACVKRFCGKAPNVMAHLGPVGGRGHRVPCPQQKSSEEDTEWGVCSEKARRPGPSWTAADRLGGFRRLSIPCTAWALSPPQALQGLRLQIP